MFWAHSMLNKYYYFLTFLQDPLDIYEILSECCFIFASQGIVSKHVCNEGQNAVQLALKGPGSR
jgi:hypothetical protein